jgi:ATP-binding cassette, subfamily A (ABC1), member 3
VNVVLWPTVAIFLEKLFYDPTYKPFARFRRTTAAVTEAPSGIAHGIAISMQGLSKKFKTSGQEEVTALSGLTLDVPQSGIFVLLGANGYVFFFASKAC